MRKKTSERVLKLYVALVMLFLALPIAVVIPSSFGNDSSLRFPPKGFSLKWFEKAWNTQAFWDAFQVSLLVAAIATAISLVIGTLAAFAIVRHTFRGKQFFEFLFSCTFYGAWLSRSVA